MLTIGSLFTGYGGLDLAVEAVLDAHTVWTSDIDLGASRIIAARWPDVPNLGDIAAVDWTAVEPVDVITGGFPCQDVSHAGVRRGLGPGTRSGLWARMADAIDHLRPGLVVFENVRGLLSAPAASDVEPCPWCMGGAGDGEPPLRALGSVLADLADLRYRVGWVGVRASDVGAPHGRFRVFGLAWLTDADVTGLERPEPAAGRLMPTRRTSAAPDPGGETIRLGTGLRPSGPRRVRGGRPDDDHPPAPTADAERVGRDSRPELAPLGRPIGRAATSWDRDAPADAAGDGRDEGRPQPARLVGRPDAAVGRDAPPADAERGELQRRGEPGVVGGPPAGAAGPRPERERDGDAAGDRGAAAPDADGDGRERRGQQEHPGVEGAPGVVAVGLGDDGEQHGTGRGAEDGATGTAWGAYEPAIRRWEQALGRPAPAPTEPGRTGSPRLSPAFVEWMMGLPDGWVTAVPGLKRNDQLKALGNGVVPQQAAAALTTLLAWRAAAAGAEVLSA